MVSSVDIAACHLGVDKEAVRLSSQPFYERAVQVIARQALHAKSGLEPVQVVPDEGRNVSVDGGHSVQEGDPDG